MVMIDICYSSSKFERVMFGEIGWRGKSSVCEWSAIVWRDKIIKMSEPPLVGPSQGWTSGYLRPSGPQLPCWSYKTTKFHLIRSFIMNNSGLPGVFSSQNLNYTLCLRQISWIFQYHPAEPKCLWPQTHPYLRLGRGERPGKLNKVIFQNQGGWSRGKTSQPVVGFVTSQASKMII